MSQFLLYLKIEPYLAQWLINEAGGNPVKLRRGSSESDILERFLTTGATGRTGEISPSEANVSIFLPTFRDKDPRYYNYLPPRARKSLERNIYVRFRCQLWKELHTLANVDCPIGELVWAWMESHGIEDDPKNWETIRQMYYRQRKVYQKNAEKSSEKTHAN